MEETTKKDPQSTEQNPSYEQLKEAAIQLQRRAVIAEERFKTLDLVAIRLNWLFKVLDNQNVFSMDFIGKCVEEIEETLTLPANVETVEPEEVN